MGGRRLRGTDLLHPVQTPMSVGRYARGEAAERAAFAAQERSSRDRRSLIRVRTAHGVTSATRWLGHYPFALVLHNLSCRVLRFRAASIQRDSFLIRPLHDRRASYTFFDNVHVAVEQCLQSLPQIELGLK
jgi:hypothetical protein